MKVSAVKSGWGAATIVALALALVLSAIAWNGAASPVSASVGDSPTTADYAALQDALTIPDLVKQVNPAVVTVYNLTSLEDSLGKFVPQGSGSGFVISKDGYIVTNWHVVTGGQQFAVALQDGTVVEAELIGSDARDDLAVVKIAPKDVKAVVPLGDSDAVVPGQQVVAIGSPLGSFTNTVTEGIISALHRDDFGQLQSNCQNYSNLIQHDAAINPGNSGGPLFNMKGEVIGVNTLGLPTTQDGTPVQGLFFAVPSNLVKVVAQQLIEDGRISAPYIGIEQQFIDPGTAAANGLDIPGGIYVVSVPSGGPADDAGLREGDIILKVDGTQITPQEGLPNILLDYQPEDTVELTILRGGRERTVDLTFGNIPDELLNSCELAP